MLEQVYKDECMFSFDTPLSAGGLFLNLASWQAFGDAFVALDHKRSGNALYLWEKWHKARMSMLRYQPWTVLRFRRGTGNTGFGLLGALPKAIRRFYVLPWLKKTFREAVPEQGHNQSRNPIVSVGFTQAAAFGASLCHGVLCRCR